MNLHLLLITATNLHIYSFPLFPYDVIFANQELRSALLLSTLSRLSRNFESSRYCFLFDAAVGGCVQSECV
jgi:hypothetical protein